MTKKVIYIISALVTLFMSIMLFPIQFSKVLDYVYGLPVKCILYKIDDRDMLFYYQGKLCSDFPDRVINEKIGDTITFYHWDKIQDSFLNKNDGVGSAVFFSLFFAFIFFLSLYIMYYTYKKWNEVAIWKSE